MESISVSRYEPSKDMVLDTMTGEMLSYEEYEKIVKKERELISREKKSIVNQLGVVERDSHKLNWKSEKGSATHFVKVYSVGKRELFSVLNDNEMLLLSLLELYTQYETNLVIWELGKSPTNKQLRDKLGWGRDKLYKALLGLRQHNVVKTTGRGTGRKIYLSPKYSFNGRHLAAETHELFFSNDGKHD